MVNSWLDSIFQGCGTSDHWLTVRLRNKFCTNYFDHSNLIAQNLLLRRINQSGVIIYEFFLSNSPCFKLKTYLSSSGLFFLFNIQEMEDSTKKSKYSRRNFLETSAAAAAGVALGLATGNLISPNQDEKAETVKMLTADGKLVAVEKRHLPPMCGKPVPVSNEVLLEWMKKGKS